MNIKCQIHNIFPQVYSTIIWPFLKNHRHPNKCVWIWSAASINCCNRFYVKRSKNISKMKWAGEFLYYSTYIYSYTHTCTCIYTHIYIHSYFIHVHTFTHTYTTTYIFKQEHLQTRFSQQPDMIETCSFHCWKAQVLSYVFRLVDCAFCQSTSGLVESNSTGRLVVSALQIIVIKMINSVYCY